MQLTLVAGVKYEQDTSCEVVPLQWRLNQICYARDLSTPKLQERMLRDLSAVQNLSANKRANSASSKMTKCLRAAQFLVANFRQSEHARLYGQMESKTMLCIKFITGDIVRFS